MREIRTIKTVILLFLVAVVGLQACKEMPPAEEFDPSNTRLHVVWSKPFYADSSYAEMSSPILVDRYVAVVGYPWFSLDKKGNRVVVFDKTSGEPPPAWKNGIEDNVDYFMSDYLLGGDNKDILFYSTRNELQSFSITKGQCLWTSIYDDVYISDIIGSPSILGSDVTIPRFNEVSRYNSVTGQKTKLCSFDIVVNTIQWAINEHNDTLGFFSNGKNSYCYNLTKDSIIWKHTTTIDYYTSIPCPPIVVENKYVLFQNKYAVSCVDFSTGERIWENTTNSTEDSPIFYHDGKLVVRSSTGISCYDVKTGNLLWKNDLGTNLSHFWRFIKMDAYKGNLYLVIQPSSAYSYPYFLYCISLATGAVNWSDVGTDKGIVGGITIDQETGYLYCRSAWSIICIDLNKTPKK